ncbi:hypothetical protein GCM10020218_089880 [Dactylosporangium vinaceum]
MPISPEILPCGNERERWEPAADTETDMSLESTSTATKTWDQFETMPDVFGATSSYNEDMYTTRIDRSDPDL